MGYSAGYFVSSFFAIKGKFSTRNGDASVIADVMKVLD
jgi:hypothetical protein